MVRKTVTPEQGEAAKRRLTALLRTPKTRSGLIAATKALGISPNFVYGWLSAGRDSGEIVVLSNGVHKQFQLAEFYMPAAALCSIYPSWLDPRTLPIHSTRSAFVDGHLNIIKEETE